MPDATRPEKKSALVFIGVRELKKTGRELKRKMVE